MKKYVMVPYKLYQDQKKRHIQDKDNDTDPSATVPTKSQRVEVPDPPPISQAVIASDDKAVGDNMQKVERVSDEPDEMKEVEEEEEEDKGDKQFKDQSTTTLPSSTLTTPLSTPKHPCPPQQVTKTNAEKDTSHVQKSVEQLPVVRSDTSVDEETSTGERDLAKEAGKEEGKEEEEGKKGLKTPISKKRKAATPRSNRQTSKAGQKTKTTQPVKGKNGGKYWLRP